MIPLQIDPSMAANLSHEAADTLSGGFAEFDPSIAEEFGYSVTSAQTFLGVPLYDTQSLLHLLIHFAFNLLVSWVIIRFFYYPRSRRKDYFFTFMVFSSAMFLLLFVMENVSIQIGFAIGLFAIFGMIRYRTETVPVREMTYLFIIIAVSIINGLSINISYAELVLADALLTGLIWLLESERVLHRKPVKLITYDRIELIVPERREELKADLERRTGLKIESIDVGAIDFLKDSAFIKITYEDKDGHANTIDRLQNVKDFAG